MNFVGNLSRAEFADFFRTQVQARSFVEDPHPIFVANDIDVPFEPIPEDHKLQWEGTLFQFYFPVPTITGAASPAIPIAKYVGDLSTLTELCSTPFVAAVDGRLIPRLQCWASVLGFLAVHATPWIVPHGALRALKAQAAALSAS